MSSVAIEMSVPQLAAQARAYRRWKRKREDTQPHTLLSCGPPADYSPPHPDGAFVRRLAAKRAERASR